jgi:hypothetical protein
MPETVSSTLHPAPRLLVPERARVYVRVCLCFSLSPPPPPHPPPLSLILRVCVCVYVCAHGPSHFSCPLYFSCPSLLLVSLPASPRPPDSLPPRQLSQQQPFGHANAFLPPPNLPPFLSLPLAPSLNSSLFLSLSSPPPLSLHTHTTQTNGNDEHFRLQPSRVR